VIVNNKKTVTHCFTHINEEQTLNLEFKIISLMLRVMSLDLG